MSSMMWTDFVSLEKEELYRLQDRVRPARKDSTKLRGPLDRDLPRHSGENAKSQKWKVTDECGEDDDTGTARTLIA